MPLLNDLRVDHADILCLMERFPTDPIEECLQAIKDRDERGAPNRAWDLRADGIRKRELHSNFVAIRDACRLKFNRLHSGLPRHYAKDLEFTDNPANYFTVHHRALTGTTVRAEMSADGSALAINTLRYTTPNGMPTEQFDAVYVGVGTPPITCIAAKLSICRKLRI